MDAPSRRSEEGTENTPLLPQSERNWDAESRPLTRKVKKVGRWLADHAAVIFMSLLLAAIIIGLIVYFTGT